MRRGGGGAKEDATERQVRKRRRIILINLKRRSDQLFPNETEQNAADLQGLRNKLFVPAVLRSFTSSHFG